ncbi:MAG: MFS transporter [Bacillaceae bacterium]|jgi:MFS transporter, putative metabolite:H+ symporter|uniref:MFS transporter n=2 Tax=Aeribacillus TaxID=1055323 RepID=A0A165WBB0_9BACI|nr:MULTISPECIES: MFS transporter [Aeribacillus]AXI39651.1 MFS transporter [Bacillaceae bacterium ZC4]REJ13232.1 MAG: MFS transporter [Bacillaceae bacterium]ASS91063.1 MFS transporter [Aeribacillus pallidus]KZM57751.1 MFS transporter [Aeribacillus pallidus]KZN94839.1 MFS transporter [Aeribacillus pallidus]
MKEMSTKKLLGIAGLAWLFDAMDVGILSFIIAALKEDWNLTAEQMSWIGSINSIGMAVGAFFFGLLSDKIGRKTVFIITLLLFSIGSGLSAFTTTLAVFLLLRFFIGMGLGGELPVASTLVSESSPTKDRGRMVVLLESFWAAGWLIAAIISYFVIPQFGWRLALILTALPAFYAIYLRMKLPDSKKFKSIQTKSNVWKNIAAVWSKKYVKQTAVLWVLWFSVVFSYYGMFLWLPSVVMMKGYSLVQSFEYVLIMTIAQLPGYFSAAWLIERIGRKFVLSLYLFGTALSAFFFGFSDTTAELLISGIFLSFFNLGAWGALYAYTPELYPTEIRGTGAGMAASFGRIGGIFGPLLVGYLAALKVSMVAIFSIFCAAIIIGALAVLLFGQETKALELE